MGSEAEGDGGQTLAGTLGQGKEEDNTAHPFLSSPIPVPQYPAGQVYGGVSPEQEIVA